MNTSAPSRTPPACRIDVSSWTIKNPDGSTPNFSYDILKRRRGEREHSCLTYARAKLRCWDRPIDQATPYRDLVSHQLLLPPEAPDLLMNPHVLWSEVEKATDWEGEPHIMAAPTVWLPRLKSQHYALRSVTEFAQVGLADKYGVAVHVIAHAPSKIAHAADFHVHLLCTARRVTGMGFSTFVPELLHDGCQTGTKAAWDAWLSANPMP